MRLKASAELPASMDWVSTTSSDCPIRRQVKAGMATHDLSKLKANRLKSPQLRSVELCRYRDRPGTFGPCRAFHALNLGQVMGSAAANTDLGKMPTVLVVDDEPVICTLASDYLRDAGYRTFEAHSAQQAIDLLEKGEHVDLVFSDIQMPGIDGFELQRWLRWNRPRVRVLLSSGVENVKAAGGYMGPPRWLVFKPYDMADLEQRIGDLIRG
jgi:CheY-like chemotaxis protein